MVIDTLSSSQRNQTNTLAAQGSGTTFSPTSSQDSTALSPIELSHKDVVSQIELLEDGLLGKGGTCLVFKGRWVNKFGPGGLVAVKVMKDAYDMSLEVLQSFSYEAQLLARLR